MKNVLLFSFLLLCVTGTSRAQSSTEICADPLDEYKLNATVQRGGLHMTSIGAVKALVVFVQFAQRESCARKHCMAADIAGFAAHLFQYVC